MAQTYTWSGGGITITDGVVAGTLTDVVLVTPTLGTPKEGTLTNCTGLPVAGGGTGASTAAGARDNLAIHTCLPVYGITITADQTITTGQRCDTMGTITISSGTITISGTGQWYAYASSYGT